MRRTNNSADGLLGFPIRGEVPDDGEVLAFEKISGQYTPKSLTSLGMAWSAITGTPTTLAGYGITDPVVLTSGSYSNPTWITGLAWSKISGTPTTLSGYGITDAQPLDTDLTALAGLSTAGIIARTGSGTAAVRTITAPAAGISIADGNGVSGNPTLSLANDLSAVEGLSGSGMAVRTATDTWTTRTITGTAGQVTVSNGDGVSGNPTLALPATITQATTFSAGLTASTFTSQGAISPSNTTVTWTAGAGSPESVVTAPVGSLYSRTDGAAGTCLYVKETGAGNTGWVAVSLNALASAVW